MKIVLQLVSHSKNYDIYQEVGGLHQKWYLPKIEAPAAMVEFTVRDVLPSQMKVV